MIYSKTIRESKLGDIKLGYNDVDSHYFVIVASFATKFTSRFAARFAGIINLI